MALHHRVIGIWLFWDGLVVSPEGPNVQFFTHISHLKMRPLCCLKTADTNHPVPYTRRTQISILSVSLKYKQIVKNVQYVLLQSNTQLNLQCFRLSIEWILNLSWKNKYSNQARPKHLLHLAVHHLCLCPYLIFCAGWGFTKIRHK
jgi:hypothetical protein